MVMVAVARKLHLPRRAKATESEVEHALGKFSTRANARAKAIPRAD